MPPRCCGAMAVPDAITIAGITGADGQVGPPLAGLRQRVYIGGVANNSADNLVQ